MTITVLPLIHSAVGILLDSRNVATASKPNITCVTTILKNDRNYSENVLLTYSPLIMYPSTGTQYFGAASVLNTYVVHDLNGLDAYTSHTVHEQDSVVVRQERANYTCAIACVLYSI